MDLGQSFSCYSIESYINEIKDFELEAFIKKFNNSNEIEIETTKDFKKEIDLLKTFFGFRVLQSHGQRVSKMPAGKF
eukprot:Awhi_evm1s6504